MLTKHPKSKIPEPAVVTLSESPLTASSEATHNTESNERLQTLNDSTSQLSPPMIVPSLTEDKLVHVYQS